MKIETTPLEDHQIKLVVDISDELEDARQRAARILARRVRIPGFRPGKAPYGVILRHLGEDAILERALELLVDELYPKAVKEANIRPYAVGKLTSIIVDQQPPTLEFEIPLETEVILGDYRALRRPYEIQAVSDEDVERALADIRQRRATPQEVTRPIEEGDQVNIRLAANRKNVEEGQDPALLREFPFPLVIKLVDEDKDEWPFPGFSRQLIGMSIGEEKTVEHVYDAESDFASLRGADASFHIVVETIKARVLPELDDAFAASLGDYANLEALRTRIRQDLIDQNRQIYNENYDDALLTEVIAGSTIKYPPQMLEREIDSVIHNLEDRLERQRQTLDLYLKSRNIDMETLRKEARPVAEDRIKRTLVLIELARVEDVKVNPQDLQAETEKTLASLSRGLKESEARRLNNQEVLNNIATNVMADMILRLAQERLRDIASGTLDQTVVSEPVEVVALASESGAAEELTDEIVAPLAEMPESVSQSGQGDPIVLPVISPVIEEPTPETAPVAAFPTEATDLTQTATEHAGESETVAATEVTDLILTAAEPAGESETIAATEATELLIEQTTDPSSSDNQS